MVLKERLQLGVVELIAIGSLAMEYAMNFVVASIGEETLVSNLKCGLPLLQHDLSERTHVGVGHHLGGVIPSVADAGSLGADVYNERSKILEHE
jgi:hypothetical protein